MSFRKPDLKNPFKNLYDPGIWKLLGKVRNYLAERDIESYIVGGFIRDVLLGRRTADVDIAVAADALEIASLVADAFGGKYVPLDDINKVARVIFTGNEKSMSGGRQEIDFSMFSGGIEEDLARRDFTIDAMAVDLRQVDKNISDIKIIDPFNGADDLGNGVIRAVSDEVFTSDAVRLLRAVRLGAELGFRVESDTEELIRRDSHLLSGVAGERVREEMLRLLAVPGAGRILGYLDELFLLTVIFPELANSKGVEQPKEHYWDVFEHSIATVIAVEFILGQGTWEYAGEEALAAVPWSPVLNEHFDREVSSGSSRKVLLKLAALLHDVCKPETRAIDTNGRMRFLGHAVEGAALAAKILERMRFSGKEIKMVETEVKHHLRPMQMSQEGMPSDRAIYRYFRDTGETGLDILYLSLADHLATRGPELDLTGWREHTGLVDYVINRHFEKENVITPPKIVDGYDIMKTFGISPGPEIGEILEKVREAQASGEVTTREEALSFIGKLAGSPGSSERENG